MALFSCFGTEPHVELWKGKTLSLGAQWNSGFHSQLSVQGRRFAHQAPSGDRLCVFTWWHHLQPQVRWGLPASGSWVHRSGWHGSVTKAFVLPLTFLCWMMATAICFFVLGSLLLLWNRKLWASSDFLISFNPGFLCFLSPPLFFPFKPLFLLFLFSFLTQSLTPFF